MILPNGCSRVSSQKANDQPPNLKPPEGSSLGPPGACMTPSSDWNTAPVSLRIGGLAFERGFDGRDVDLLHLHHRVHGPLGGGAVAARDRLHQCLGGDLPREAPFVLAPAALAFLTAA